MIVTTTARTILVTGAGSGIGAAICRRLAAPGVNLLVHTGSKRERAEAVAAECAARGALCRVETGDLADRDVPRRLVAAAIDRFGGLDALVANAGFADKRPLGTLDDDGFERSLAVITAGFFRLADAARPHLLTAKTGRIVAVSSLRRRGLSGLGGGQGRARRAGALARRAIRRIGGHRQLRRSRLCPQG
jgi:3-oxoacyl-[acyl-carrier protein] reductase